MDPGSEGDVASGNASGVTGINAGDSLGMVGDAISDVISWGRDFVVDPLLDLGGKVFGSLGRAAEGYVGDLAVAAATPIVAPLDALLPGTPIADIVRGAATSAAHGTAEFGYGLVAEGFDSVIPDNPLSDQLGTAARDMRPFGWTGIWDGNGRDVSLGSRVQINPELMRASPQQPVSRLKGLPYSGALTRGGSPVFSQRSHRRTLLDRKNASPTIYK
jgi:hypothetical protein